MRELSVYSGIIDLYFYCYKIIMVFGVIYMEKIIYYKDELNDEFAGDNLKPKVIDENYIYLPKGIWKKFTRFFWYRIVATPLAFLYMKFGWHHKIIGKKNFKKYRKQAVFVYGNHTHNMADAFIPSMVSTPQDAFVIVNPNNLSIPVIGHIVPSLGGIPLPINQKAMRNFNKCITRRVEQKRFIMIYPEAHIWPFYTKIRPYVSLSFSYPIHYKAPAFALTNTYVKRKFGKKPRIITYIDGPFYPDKGLSLKEARENLRDKVYNQHVLRSKNSNYEYIKYIKKEVEE